MYFQCHFKFGQLTIYLYVTTQNSDSAYFFLVVMIDYFVMCESKSAHTYILNLKWRIWIILLQSLLAALESVSIDLNRLDHHVRDATLELQTLDVS